MKIVCKLNNPNETPSGVPRFNFGLELEKEYMVMGMLIAANQLWYMIDEKGKPDFYPFQLFEISDNTLNPNWHFKLFEKDDGIYPFKKEAMWGYLELCTDDKHYEGIIDRDHDILQIYFKRKIETENH